MMEALSIALIVIIVFEVVWPFTWENANKQAKVLYELGGRPRVVKKWYGWVVEGEYK